MVSKKQLWLCLLLVGCLARATEAQPTWTILPALGQVQIDGFIEEWKGIPELILEPNASGISPQGDFGAHDLSVSLRGLWDKERLYLGLQWKDDVWDVEEVPRRQAVWITPDKQRRDRMIFFDYFRFLILEPDYDFTFWFTPRLNDRGPFLWHRLLEGLKGMETATASPMVVGRFENGVATLEVLLYWKELKIKPRTRRPIPLSLLAADSDLPGKTLETKLKQLKWLEWSGQMILSEKR